MQAWTPGLESTIVLQCKVGHWQCCYQVINVYLPLWIGGKYQLMPVWFNCIRNIEIDWIELRRIVIGVLRPLDHAILLIVCPAVDTIPRWSLSSGESLAEISRDPQHFRHCLPNINPGNACTCWMTFKPMETRLSSKLKAINLHQRCHLCSILSRDQPGASCCVRANKTMCHHDHIQQVIIQFSA